MFPPPPVRSQYLVLIRLVDVGEGGNGGKREQLRRRQGWLGCSAAGGQAAAVSAPPANDNAQESLLAGVPGTPQDPETPRPQNRAKMSDIVVVMRTFFFKQKPLSK